MPPNFNKEEILIIIERVRLMGWTIYYDSEELATYIKEENWELCKDHVSGIQNSMNYLTALMKELQRNNLCAS